MDDENTQCSDEAELLEKLVQDLQGQFHLLVIKYGETIFNVVLHLIDSPEDAEDITQEIYEKIWKDLHKIKGKGQDFREKFRESVNEEQEFYLKSWLIKIARNTCHNHKRKQRRRKRFLPFGSLSIDKDFVERLLRDPVPSAEDDAVLRENIAEISYLLRRLPDHEREIVVLHYIARLSDRQVSEVLKRMLHITKKPDTIKKVRLRAINKLREMAKNQERGEHMARTVHNEDSLKSQKEHIWNQETTI